MKRLPLSRHRNVLLLACALVPAITAPSSADEVTEWNEIMQATVSVPPTNPNYQARWGAIVQLAVFEAVNAIEGDYESYLGVIEAAPGASAEAAAIVAAHDTLVGLRPDQELALGLLRDASLADITDGPHKDAGIDVGQEAAAAMLLLREADGWDAVVPYTPGTDPGDFVLTTTAFLPGWGLVVPFGLESGSQFRVPPPPALDTKEYARAYNEVMLLGKSDSLVRPQDRTDVARFYAAASPVQVWNSAGRQASAAQGLTLSENARIFALLGMAMADASFACWDSKYEYNFWRPQSAIRSGDLDGNERTDADPSWAPLINTPGHPTYVSGHATVSGAARTVLEEFFGSDGHAVTLTTPAQPTIVLTYTGWDQITDDIDDARIYGGIHFRFDQKVGSRQGHDVGKYLLQNYLRPSLEFELEEE